MKGSLSEWQLGVKLAVFMLFASYAGSFCYEHYLHATLSRLGLIQRYLTLGSLILLVFSTLPSEKMRYKCVDYTCVLLWLGCIVSGYHLLLQYGVLPEFDFLVGPSKISAYSSKAAANSTATITELPIIAGAFVTFVFLFIYISICFKKERDPNSP